MSGRSLLNLCQFFHAWVVCRLLARTCTRVHPVDESSTLIVAPHPDDETLGCGGLIAQKRALGAKVTVVFLSDGSKGTLRPEEAPDRGLAARRRIEALLALEHLRVDLRHVHFWRYADGGLKDLPDSVCDEIVGRLMTVIRNEKVRSVYVTHRCDGHADHQSAFAFAKAAVDRCGLPVRLYQYAVWMWWSQPLAFKLRWKGLSQRTLHRVGAAREQKLRALECHQSQLPRFPWGFLKAFPFETELFFEEVIGEGIGTQTRLA